LKSRLLEETSFPILKRGQALAEDEIIPLFPYLPGRNDEKFHEEIMV
jgi:hypothetical protein